ncbi:MAG: response regulator, partial [Calditrichaeota bacterium]
RGEYDVLVVDYHMPRCDGLEVVRRLAAEGKLPPTIMLTATGNEEVAVEALKWGVADYIVKESRYLEVIPSVIQKILHEHHLAEEKQRAEEALRKSEATNRALLNAIPDAMIHFREEGTVLNAKLPPHCPLIREKELPGKKLEEVLPPEMSCRMKACLQRALKTGATESFEFTFQGGEETRYYETRVVVCGNAEGLAIIRDITPRVRSEQERERLIAELQEALSKIKTLRGLIPICASCKKIRDDRGYWQQLERYLQEHSEAAFSHSYCPECIQKHFPDLYEEERFR